jgi:CheY-like chemotaxis protein
VDDENFIINSVSSMIRSQKLKCDCFSDGKYCYEKILEKTKCNCKRKYYKLILMDIYMHEWSGIKTCEKIGELIQQDIIPKTINVVLISAHKEKDLNLPNYDFIKGFYQKPVCKKTIVSILNEFYL